MSEGGEMAREWRRDEFCISTDPDRLDLAVVHGYLTQSYWAAGVPLDTVRRSIAHSLVFGLYEGERQIGFARVISDRATFAYVCDVFVLEDWRGRGLGKWLVATVTSHPDLQGLRRWTLATRDAHGLYCQVGFTDLKRPGMFMERHDPDVYRRSNA
jgi:GNAT superfamily N-acetyltransferase